MENLVINPHFWTGKRVLVTGHTGFKGAWLTLWLSQLGASVTGYSLAPPTTPSLFKLANVESEIDSIEGDIRDLEHLSRIIVHAQPEIVFHLAAQPLVGLSYREPVSTFETNVMGTVHVLESVRRQKTVRVLINITSDKCYENREWHWGYRENEPMGGHDPYSASKGCSELVTTAYRRSFFHTAGGTALASARAGNVVGGGDWAEDRLIPDMIRGFLQGRIVILRNPESIRPWQHVLEPLRGYLLLAQRLWDDPERFAGAWNFGPTAEDARPVGWIAAEMARLWGDGSQYAISPTNGPHEARLLRLDCAKARAELQWIPTWTLSRTLSAIVEWFRAYQSQQDMRMVTLAQIHDYQQDAQPKGTPTSPEPAAARAARV